MSANAAASRPASVPDEDKLTSIVNYESDRADEPVSIFDLEVKAARVLAVTLGVHFESTVGQTYFRTEGGRFVAIRYRVQALYVRPECEACGHEIDEDALRTTTSPRPTCSRCGRNACPTCGPYPKECDCNGTGTICLYCFHQRHCERTAMES